MRRRKQYSIFALVIATALTGPVCRRLRAQPTQLGVPSIVASPKGPNQINLSWGALSNPGYGYLVEIQSSGDSRYSTWQEVKPVPPAGGYQCDNTIQINGASCNISDPAGVHVYNPPSNGIPYWVTDATYIDPQDGSAAQFIAGGLKPNTSYSFRVRTYSGNTSPVYGAYSNAALGSTANYRARYVSPTGNDASDGAGPDDAHAWRTLSHATGAIRCGDVLIVNGGNYPADKIGMSQNCSADSKAVVLVNPGDTATITSAVPGSDNAVTLNGAYLVVDGMTVSVALADYHVAVGGSHNALLNLDVHPPAVPMAYSGVHVSGDHNLVYRSYLHDYLSPDATQNPSGNGGFVLTIEGGNAAGNAIWSNHLTRGGHDVSLCIRGCNNNRWLNNIMDGGWGMGFEAIQGSTHNLIEGNYIKDVGQLVTFYKPSIEISAAFNTVRRNISVNAKSNGLEVSALYGGDTAVGTLVYNNVFYRPGTCYFQSHNGGVDGYDNGFYANNICYKMQGNATDIYLPNKNSQIVNNDILFVDTSGVPQPDKAIIIWNHDAEADFQYAKSLSYAEKSYNPPFGHNKGLDVPPQFADEAAFDFHLSPESPLNGAGTCIADSVWGATVGTTDVGAFGIAPVSTILASRVVNAASYTGGTVAPGQMLAVFGSGLGPCARVDTQVDSAGKLKTLLADTQVTFDGVPAPLIYVQSGQVGTIAPYSIDGKSKTVIQVSYQGTLAKPLTLPVAATAPGVFTNDGSGQGQGAILNQDNSRNSSDNPAPIGSIVSVYATGEGQTNPAGEDGKAGGPIARLPIQTVTATIGGVDAPVKYAGGVSGLTAGVLQVNLEVPAGVTASGSVAVVLRVGGNSTQSGVTIAVR